MKVKLAISLALLSFPFSLYASKELPQDSVQNEDESFKMISNYYVCHEQKSQTTLTDYNSINFVPEKNQRDLTLHQLSLNDNPYGPKGQCLMLAKQSDDRDVF